MNRKTLIPAMALLVLGAAPLAMAQTASPGATPSPSATMPSSTPQSPSAPSSSTTRSPSTATPSTTSPNSATMSGNSVNSTNNMTSAQRQLYSSCMAKAQNNGSTSAQNQQTCMSQMPQSTSPNH